MAGTGKTTLMAQWLEDSSQPSAWLSLDERDNDRIVFLTYLCGAIRTVFPTGCTKALDLLHAPQTPSAREITTLMVNELAGLLEGPAQEGGRAANGLILALDDYHNIIDPAVHEILAGLIEHLPRGVHLALATRTDPQLPLAGWRARREMTEIRSYDLRFTPEEAQIFLERTTDRKLDPETIRLLENQTEGWVVGLRLAALSMRTRSDHKAFAQGFKGTDSQLIVEYLLSEVLTRQSTEIQDFVLRTSVLDRFCAPLCEAVTGVSADQEPGDHRLDSRGQPLLGAARRGGRGGTGIITYSETSCATSWVSRPVQPTFPSCMPAPAPGLLRLGPSMKPCTILGPQTTRQRPRLWWPGTAMP